MMPDDIKPDHCYRVIERKGRRIIALVLRLVDRPVRISETENPAGRAEKIRKRQRSSARRRKTGDLKELSDAEPWRERGTPSSPPLAPCPPRQKPLCWGNAGGFLFALVALAISTAGLFHLAL
jgi:hypothetical protein